MSCSRESGQVQGLHRGQGVKNTNQIDREHCVRDICAAGRKVIGLTPIEPIMLELQKRTTEEAIVMDVRSYLKCEMKILPSVIEELDIVRVFAPAKENWNVLYVELGSEFQADSIFSYTKVMKGDNRVVRWFPK